MASERQDIHGLQKQQPNECRSFLPAVIKDRTIFKSWPFLNNYWLIIVPKFVSGYGLFRAFYFLSFSSYLYQVRGIHCEKRVRCSYLQLNMSWSNSVPIVATFWFSCSLDKTNLLFWNNRASQSCNKKKQLSFDKSQSIFNKIIQQTNRSTS